MAAGLQAGDLLEGGGGGLSGTTEDYLRFGLALANGGTSEGPPGERFPGFYAAYFRDPDGNKIMVMRLGD